ncbi:MAG: hypothetical protein ACJZ9F_06935 [Rhodospirillaceae bacterium]
MVAAPGLTGPEDKVWVPKGRPVAFHDGPTNDQLFAMVMALTVEVSVLRERLDTQERVSEANGGISTEDIETYNPDNAALADRGALRNRILHKVFRVLREERVRMEENMPDDYYDIMKDIDDMKDMEDI